MDTTLFLIIMRSELWCNFSGKFINFLSTTKFVRPFIAVASLSRWHDEKNMHLIFCLFDKNTEEFYGQHILFIIILIGRAGTTIAASQSDFGSLWKRQNGQKRQLLEIRKLNCGL